ncbi:MAG: hypothetical protein KA096_02120 [Bacteroidales bacterium]|nr:hypothetical protein [Bacteroidales bacterium]
MKKTLIFSIIPDLVLVTLFLPVSGQWASNGSHIYNTNSGNAGIGTSTPASLLYVARNTTEPTVTIRNSGGSGGATFSMVDLASGANWKFKATLSGGFKIRDHTNSLDVIVIEPGSFTNAIYIKNSGNIGISTGSPDPSALLDISSGDKGFQLPRLTQAEIQSIQGPADGLIVYCTTDEKFYVFLSSANTWKEISYGSGTISPAGLPCGTPLAINHVAGSVAPVNKSTVYGTVTNVPGELTKCWITSNLGADNQATYAGDATETAAGWYWQFNRLQGYKHDGSQRTPNTTWIDPITENSDWTTSNDPCNIELGAPWRIPTNTEWTNVSTAGGWSNWNGPWNSLLKMHAAGFLQSNDGSLTFRGSNGSYWSGTQSDNSGSFSPYFDNFSFYIGYGVKSFGNTVRCVK